jgi:hypothetical protein
VRLQRKEASQFTPASLEAQFANHTRSIVSHHLYPLCTWFDIHVEDRLHTTVHSSALWLRTPG